MTADGQDAVVLQLILRGRASGEADGRRIETGPGDLLVLDLTRPFSITDAEPREGVSVAVARVTLAAVCPEPERLHGQVFGPDRNSLFGDFLRSLLPRLPSLPNTVGRGLSRVVVELFGVMLERPVADALPEDRAKEAESFDRQLIAALSYIDAHLNDPELDPSGVAVALGLSRTRLYKLFEAAGGIAQHIWKRRLAAVHQALLNADERRSISELAFAWGFASEAHFARAFRAAYGQSPGQIRRDTLGRG